MHPEPQVLDDLVRRIVAVTHPRRIILFGSAAHSAMGANSDIDVLVVVPDGVHRRRTAQMIYQHLIGLDVAVDVVVATEGDLQHYGDNFSLVYYPVLREGKTIEVQCGRAATTHDSRRGLANSNTSGIQASPRSVTSTKQS